LKVKILQKKGQKLKFLIEGTDPAFANSLRRIMITEVPTLAVHWIDVHENNSALFDEVLSHRIGMIPLKFNPRRFNFTQDCTCKGKGCPLCQVIFALDKKGPCMVTAGDLKSSDKTVSPTDPRIPIVELLDGQSLKLEAVARLGIGSTHSKFQAANASYHYYPEVKCTGSKADMQKAVRICPTNALSISGSKLVIKDPEKCNLCMMCMENVKSVEIKGDKSRIIFSVESISGLEPEYIVTKAAELLQDKGQEFKKNLAKV